MSDPWSLDAIVAEAEALAYKEQKEAEAKAKTEAAAKKKALELNARQEKLKKKMEEEAKWQAEVDFVMDLEKQMYTIAEGLQNAKGQTRKDIKAELKRMDALCKKARGELSREARKLHQMQSIDVAGAIAGYEDEAADARAEVEALQEMEVRKIKAEAAKRKAEEDAAYASIKKKQTDDMARRKAEQEAEQLRLEKLRAKYEGGGNMLDAEAPAKRPVTADSDYNAADVVSVV